jgi:intraflagellar transport protein 57
MTQTLQLQILVYHSNSAAMLKKLGIPFEHGPAKLKQGYGDAVIYVLQAMVDILFNEKKFQYKKPVQKSDEY